MNDEPTSGRSGPFWDAVEGRAPLPRAAATLGMEILKADPRGSVELAFNASEDFTNPVGNVLGAFLAAMLYDTVGPALLATLGPDQFQSTLELKTEFQRPARPGWVFGHGRVVRRDGDLAHLEAFLTDPGGATLATATALARVIDLDQAPSAV
ncbi:PaaI family thioesterase [Actinomadura sp. B10D3]|uniref:PaaI family thioesterase n=1 Tax=Actinomadura sp. B10D3 TaxID=3153557 RepID=UPI00325D14DA